MTDENKARNSADNLETELATLPEKYQGKSAVEIAKMHMEAEKAFSRQGTELGEYRKLATTLAETSSRPSVVKTEEKRPEVTADDLFADPAKAIDDVIDSHPALKKARETSENLERQLAFRDFESRNPSFKEDINDASFVEWVEKSPALARLAVRANSFDFEAADQLFGLWNEKKSIKQSVEKLTKETIDKQKRERDGTLEGASGADASNEVIINRAEMRELQRLALMGDPKSQAKWKDPKFQAMRRKAYQDKRF